MKSLWSKLVKYSRKEVFTKKTLILIVDYCARRPKYQVDSLESILSRAVRTSEYNLVSTLLSLSSLRVDDVMPNGQTNFSQSCINGDIKMMRILAKDKRVNVNFMYNDLFTPLMIACVDGNTEVVRTLCKLPGICLLYTSPSPRDRG